MPKGSPTISLFAPPYSELTPLEGPTVKPAQLRAHCQAPGSALIWRLVGPPSESELRVVACRPGGASLIAVLPDPTRLQRIEAIKQSVALVRPHGVLPSHLGPALPALRQVLRRPPDDLASDFTDYLRWRGIMLDGETRRVVRQIVDLSEQLRSISAVARSLFLSRRALGRRFMRHGLPVPSHWLQLARILRVAIRLQNSAATVSSLAYEAGYPDGFSLSNQMHRLLGYRPSEIRGYLGWEWIVETWLRQEAAGGSLTPNLTLAHD